MVSRHNEKMLPSSYSIAGWQQWLCITSDTVWCITSTWKVRLRLPEALRTPKTPAAAPTSALERGPDFAERAGVQLFEISAWDMGHTALC